MKQSILLIAILLIAGACSNKTTYTPEKSVAMGFPRTNEDKAGKPTTLPAKPPVKIMTVKQAKAMAKATAFKMNGEYSKNIGVTLDPEGNLSYFPDPKDITADSEPLDLGNGWWLNRQGLGPNSVFTNYTFPEFASLPEVPTPEQFKNEIIPGSHVLQFVELPYNIGEAPSHIDEIKQYLKDF